MTGNSGSSVQVWEEGLVSLYSPSDCDAVLFMWSCTSVIELSLYAVIKHHKFVSCCIFSYRELLQAAGSDTLH